MQKYCFPVILCKINNVCCCVYRSSPTWQRVRLSGTCVWWTCTRSAACPPMHVVSLTPSSDLEPLWAQHKIFPTGNERYHRICVHGVGCLAIQAHWAFCVYSGFRRGNLPWLYYGDEPGLASRVLQTEPVPISFSFRGKNKVSYKLSSSSRYHTTKAKRKV